MVRKIRSRLSLAVGILGVVLTIATIGLPLLKFHQTAIGTGPTSPYGNSNTTLSGYLIPTIDQGSALNIAVTGYAPDSISFSMFPTSEGDLSPSGPPLFILSNFSHPITRLSIISPTTQAYGIYIVSGNRTQFVLAVEGTWSPYVFVKQYSPETLFLVLVGFFAYYYFRQWERRRATEERAVEELAMERRTKPSGVG